MLNWFSFKTNVTKYEDSFARTLEGKLLGIRSAIEAAMSDDSQTVILVAHFTDTFSQLQDMLDEHAISYEVGSELLNQKWFESLHATNSGLTLTLAEMLEPFPADDESTTHRAESLSVMVAEKHPLASRDQKIQDFCGSLPCLVKWGYFLSFEDAVVDHLVDERALKVLDMFGMGENELINSKMVSNLLKHALKKMEANCKSTEDADSAAQWLELNVETLLE